MSDEKNSKKNYESGVYAQGSELGKKSEYIDRYSPQLLHAIARRSYRDTIEGSKDKLSSTCLSQGCDIWHAYELSCLQPKGLPCVYILRLYVSAKSSNIIESKSLKLYLNSFNQTVIHSRQALLATLSADLAAVIGEPVECELFDIQESQSLPDSLLPQVFTGDKETSGYQVVELDRLEVSCDSYRPDARLLALEKSAPLKVIAKSHLLRSNCPITNQPDWASLSVVYDNSENGLGVNMDSLLKYIVSYRQHNGFHEQTVEKIFTDLLAMGLTSLLVSAQYTRRGGIDINPIRTTGDLSYAVARTNRQ